jgi:hypothetical protein
MRSMCDRGPCRRPVEALQARAGTPAGRSSRTPDWAQSGPPQKRRSEGNLHHHNAAAAPVPRPYLNQKNVYWLRNKPSIPQNTPPITHSLLATAPDTMAGAPQALMITQSTSHILCGYSGGQRWREAAPCGRGLPCLAQASSRSSQRPRANATRAFKIPSGALHQPAAMTTGALFAAPRAARQPRRRVAALLAAAAAAGSLSMPEPHDSSQ